MPTVAEVEDKIREVNAATRAVEIQTDDASQKARRVRQKVSSARSQSRQAEMELSQTESRARSLDFEISTLERDLATVQRDLNDANRVISQKSSEKSRVTRDLTNAIQEIYKLTNQSAEENRAVESLRRLQQSLELIQRVLSSLEVNVREDHGGNEESRLHSGWLEEFRSKVELYAPAFDDVRDLDTYKTELYKVMSLRESISLTSEANWTAHSASNAIRLNIERISELYDAVRTTAQSAGVAVARWISPGNGLLSTLEQLDDLVYRLQNSLEGQRRVIQKRIIAREDLIDQVVMMWRTLLRLRLHAANVEEAGHIILSVDSSFFSAEYLNWLHWWLRSRRLAIEQYLFQDLCPFHALRDARILLNIVRTLLATLDDYPLSEAGSLQARIVLEEYRDITQRSIGDAKSAIESEVDPILEEWNRRLSQAHFAPESECALLQADVAAASEINLHVETSYLRFRAWCDE